MELRDSEDVVVVTVVFSAGLMIACWKRDGREPRVEESNVLVVFSVGLVVAGWKRVEREQLVKEPTWLPLAPPPLSRLTLSLNVVSTLSRRERLSPCHLRSLRGWTRLAQQI